MGRTVRGGNRNHTPNVRPVQKVELSEKNTRQRLIAVIVLLVIASGAFMYALNGLMSNDSGWTNIEASSSAEIHCGDDFIFQYYVGAAGVNATAEKKALTLLYTDSIVKAYKMFSMDESFEGITNVYDLNQHPNETMVVDDALYHAFELIAENGNRAIYLAPVYAEYENLFFCNDDSETVSYDAYQNGEVAAYFSEVAAYGNDPSKVNVELLGDNQVRLSVSDDYLAFAEKNYISDFIDFSWMKNAFITDYVADVMIDNGYTLGSLTSYDGFTRNLDQTTAIAKLNAGSDSSETTDGNAVYSFNMYDRQGNVIYPAGVMHYNGERSIVSLHNYPMSDKEKYNYYEFKSGDIRTRYADTTDGLCKSAVNNMAAYADNMGCAEILLKVSPVYIADMMDTEAVKNLAENGIQTIFGENSVLYYTDPGLELTDLYDKDGVHYTSELLE